MPSGRPVRRESTRLDPTVLVVAVVMTLLDPRTGVELALGEEASDLKP